MAANDFYDDDDDEGGKVDPLAALPAAARKHYRKLERDHAQLMERLEKADKADRKRTVEAVLKSKGLPEKVASLYTGDDASEEAVGSWLESFADVFGLKSEGAPADGSQQEAGTPQGVSERHAQFLQQMQDTSGQAQSMPDDSARQKAAENATTPEELRAALAAG